MAARAIAFEIASDASLREKYIVGNGFSRKRKIAIDDVVVFLMSCAGNSMNKEVYDYFMLERDIPSVPAMVQRRSLLRPEGVAYFCRRLTSLLESVCRSLPPAAAGKADEPAVTGRSED